MKNLRKGNDLNVKWQLESEGEPFSLEGKDVTLYLKSAFGKTEINDFVVSGNAIYWTFYGKDQKHTGRYSLELLINEGKVGMVTVDVCNFVNLVSHSCSIGGNDAVGVETESVELQSELGTVPMVVDQELNEESEHAIANKAVTTELKKLEVILDGYTPPSQTADVEGDGVGAKTINTLVVPNVEGKMTYKIVALSEINFVSDDDKQHTFVAIANAPTGTNQVNTLAGISTSKGSAESTIAQGSTIVEGVIDTNNLGQYSGTIQDIYIRHRMRGTVQLQYTLGESEEGLINAVERLEKEKVGKTELATINGQSLINGGNIVISGGGSSIDDEEIQEALAERNVGSVDAYGELEEPNIPSGGYDDTEIRNELAELSEEKEDKTNKVTSLSDESTDEQYPSAKAVYTLKERISENEVMIEDLQNTKIDKENDDYYPSMSVGTADNLAGVEAVDSDFTFRQSGGGAISDGVARVQSIKGNSVVWNQKIDTTKYVSKTQNGVTFTKNADGSISVSTDANGATADTNINIIVKGAFKDHYLFMDGCPSGGSTSSYYIHDLWSGRNDIGPGILWKSSENTADICIVVKAGTIITTSLVFRPRLCDVTQAFQRNTPTTIAEFYARIPQGIDLNAYNEGEVIHMDVQSIESQGVNAWDEEWEKGTFNDNGEEVTTQLNNTLRCVNPIEVLPNTEYYFAIPNTASGSYMGFAYFYDNEGKYINTAPIAGTAYPKVKTPSNAATLRFNLRSEYGTTYNHDICINISDTAINGKYFPYIKRVEDLAVIRKYFPNGMKSASTAHDEIRYNKASGKWEKVVRIGEVDMGTLNYIYQPPIEGTYPHGYYSTNVEGKAIGNNNMLCAMYSVTVDWVSVGVRGADSSNKVYVKDSAYTSAASFKAAMSGVMFYYELAEPIVEELDAEDQFKDLDYQVWNLGTERAIAEGKSSALSADITYGFNAIGKIKELESLVAALRAKVGI
jgi:hypothetical protein